MTISLVPEDTRLRQFACAGGETSFPVTFPFFAAADLAVLRLRGGVTTELILGVEYEVAGAGDPAGGTVTLALPAQAGDMLVVLGAQPVSRLSQWTDGQALTAAALNGEFARWWIALQQLRRDLDRTLRLPPTDLSGLGELPPEAERADRLLGFDASGRPIVRDLPEAAVNAPGVFWGGTAAGTANALVLTVVPAITAYGDGQTLYFLAAATNTGAVTANVNGLGVRDIRDENGAALGAGALVAGRLYGIQGLIGGAFRLLRAGTGRDLPLIDATSPGSPPFGLTYSATTTTTPAEREPFFLRLDRDADAGATLAINGGPAYQLRRENGAALNRSDVRASVVHVALRISTLIYVLRVANALSVTSRLDVMNTTGSVDRRVPGDAFHRDRVLMDGNGVTLLAGGTGDANNAIAALRAQTDGDVRVFNRLLVGTPAYEPFTIANPASIVDDLAAALTEVPVVHGRDNRDVVAITTTAPYLVSVEDYIRVVASGAWLDFSTLQVNRTVRIEMQAGSSAVFYYGGGMTWRGTTAEKLAIPASSSWLVTRTQTQIAATQLPDFTTTSAAALPSYAAKCAWVPAQSWGVHAEQDIWQGWQAEMTRLGLPPSMWVVQGCAAGASALQEENDTGSNWWYDHSAAANGPLLTAALTRLTDPATRGPIPPDLTACFSWLGLNDAQLSQTLVGMADSGPCTPATWIVSHHAVEAAVRSTLGLPALKFLILPLPNQPVGVFTEASLTAVRQAQIGALVGRPHSHRGPDTYDLWRYDTKRHLTYRAQTELGRRLARFYAAAVHGSTVYLGPRIVGMTVISARQVNVTILRGPGGIPGGTFLNRPLRPVGFGLRPPGSGIVSVPLYAIARYSWTTSGIHDVLQIFTAEDMDTSGGGPRLFYGEGFMGDARHRSRVIYGDDGFGPLPLLTHLSGDYAT